MPPIHAPDQHSRPPKPHKKSISCPYLSAILSGHARQPLDTVRESPLDTFSHDPGVEERERTVERDPMRYAASWSSSLDDVIETQVCTRQARLRREQRVGLDGDEFERQGQRAW